MTHHVDYDWRVPRQRHERMLNRWRPYQFTQHETMAADPLEQALYPFSGPVQEGRPMQNEEPQLRRCMYGTLAADPYARRHEEILCALSRRHLGETHDLTRRQQWRLGNWDNKASHHADDVQLGV